MSFVSTLNNLESKFSWSLFGFVLAVFFGSLTIYTEFFKVDTPYLTTEILSETNVLSFNEDVKELKVFWGDIDIKNLEKTISVASVRVKNDGGSSLLKEHYDSDYPVTILIENAQIMEVELMSASSSYLRERASISFHESKVFLPEVILDEGNSYVFKVLLLHGNSVNPKFSMMGKIASISELKIERLNEEKKIGFWGEVFSGDLWVQLVRGPIYFFGFMFSIVLTFLPIIAASEFLAKHKRKRILKKYKEMGSLKCDEIQDYLFNLYLDNGIGDIERINNFISDARNLECYVEKSKKYLRDEYREGYYLQQRYMAEDPSYQSVEGRSSFKKYRVYSLLNKSGVIEVQDGVAKVKEGASELIADFLKFVQIREK
ncbi:hypothetical protein BTO03_25055 [Vibrio parahaemolyticus]|nr:hypothetical protein [Vibrio parahaemolyticus]EJG0028988.1 hypothetical protein [Vibrio alginolyticus]EJC7061800.1 hypothetical protein [Vibrio parahaemolyticus]ELK2079991.1 hypothetical protein [Vibrio alginolyticus]EMA2429530.1 hypothetical protein [Vibrio alginolyticus]OOX69732.1 hypothetical protein BJL74_22650 [Vibrio parahaemolyticus]